jgi:hypothetical protein
MHPSAAVVVRKGGFFSALVHGIFGTLIVVLICGTLFSLYGINVVDRHVGQISTALISNLPEWQKLLPPSVAEAINDRRAPDYRKSVGVEARFVPGEDRDEPGVIVLEIANNGDETVSLLSLRIVAEDGKQVPRHQESIYAATPVAFERDWPGPLLAGTTRRMAVPVWDARRTELKPVVEVTDLRVTLPRRDVVSLPERAEPRSEATRNTGETDVPPADASATEPAES